MREPESSAAMSAQELDMQAAAWLERRDCGSWNAADQAMLDDWLSQSLAHRVAYWRMNAAWSRTERLMVLRSMRRSEGELKSPMRRSLSRGAAVLGFAALLAGAIQFYPRDNGWTYATPLGGHETIRLGDGSQIELNTNTSIRVAAQGDTRKVWLDKGEAFFQIRHDAAHPFTVITRDLRIVDLGTRFLVRQDGQKLFVSLVEGKARIEPSNGSDRPPRILTPGDVAVATADTISVMRKPMPVLDAQLSWRRDVLVFDHTTLREAAAEFNRYNSEKLVIADPQAAGRTIGGTFPKNGLVDFAEVARQMLGLTVTRHGEEIVISR